jgi:hypothetical protein
MRIPTTELALVLSMLTESRKAIEVGKTTEGLRLLTWAEEELARHMHLDIQTWRKATA